MQTTPGPATKKAKVKASVSVPLKERNAYNHHFFNKEAEFKMKDFESFFH